MNILRGVSNDSPVIFLVYLKSTPQTAKLITHHLKTLAHRLKEGLLYIPTPYAIKKTIKENST